MGGPGSGLLCGSLCPNGVRKIGTAFGVAGLYGYHFLTSGNSEISISGNIRASLPLSTIKWSWLRSEGFTHQILISVTLTAAKKPCQRK